MSIFLDEEEDLDYAELVHQIGNCVCDARGSHFGWLSSDGVFISTGHTRHDLYARRVLGVDPIELEKKGWVKIGIQWQPVLFPGATLSEQQAAFLLEKLGD